MTNQSGIYYTKLTIDADNNIFIVGSQDNPGTGLIDMLIEKYSYKPAADSNGGEFAEVRVFPNKITADIKQAEIGFYNPQSGTVEIRILNDQGKQVWEKTLDLDQGMQYVKWDIGSTLSTGIYLVFVQYSSGLVQHGKVLLLQ